MMHISDWVGLIGLLMGLTTFVGGAIAWYKGSVEKRYAASRDFAHIRRNQEQLLANLDHYQEEQDRSYNHLLTEMVQIKAVLMALLARSGDSVSGILRDRG